MDLTDAMESYGTNGKRVCHTVTLKGQTRHTKLSENPTENTGHREIEGGKKFWSQRLCFVFCVQTS